MRSIPLAMTWEMLAFRKWYLLAGALGANLFPILLITAMRHDGPLPSDDPNMILMHVVMTQLNMFVFGICVMWSQGTSTRLYSFPITTSTMITWHLVPAMTLMAIQSVVGTLLLNAVFQLDWPIWGPAVYVAVALSAIQA